MEPFIYKQKSLFCEQVSFNFLAKKFGTPLYVYSQAALKNQFQRFKKAFGKSNVLICYSMKANSSRAILKTFIREGSGIDVVTGGELSRALSAGCPPEKIVYSGVGKTEAEISQALKVGILQFNVESEMELKAIGWLAQKFKKKAPVALRVNPDVNPRTHAYIATGLKKSKFGIEHDAAVRLFRRASQMRGLKIVGIDCHIGSQLTSLSPFVAAAERIVKIVQELKEEGISIRQIDFGGGLGITYKNETPPTPEAYARAVLGVFKKLCVRANDHSPLLILEPGRFLVGNAGCLLTRVIYNKSGEAKKFVIVDAASNDLVRPSLYGAYHEILPVQKRSARNRVKVDVVGPICETGDFLAEDRQIAEAKTGELLAIMSAGAYGFSMSSTYNSRPRPAEVMVRGRKAFLIRGRETVGDLTKGEKVPGFLT